MRFSKNGGIRVSSLCFFIVGIVLLVGGFILYTGGCLNSCYEDFMQAEAEYRNCEENARQLQAASDALTAYVRQFALSGDREYLDAYFAETSSERREQAQENLHATGEEAEIFARAKSGSDLLMDMEYHAAKLVLAAQEADLSDLPRELQDYLLPETA